MENKNWSSFVSHLKIRPLSRGCLHSWHAAVIPSLPQVWIARSDNAEPPASCSHVDIRICCDAVLLLKLWNKYVSPPETPGDTESFLGGAQSLTDVTGALAARKTGCQTEPGLNPAFELHTLLCMAEVIWGVRWDEGVKHQVQDSGLKLEWVYSLVKYPDVWFSLGRELLLRAGLTSLRC